jgi:hypothetical protein
MQDEKRQLASQLLKIKAEILTLLDLADQCVEKMAPQEYAINGDEVRFTMAKMARTLTDLDRLYRRMDL